MSIDVYPSDLIVTETAENISIFTDFGLVDLIGLMLSVFGPKATSMRSITVVLLIQELHLAT